MRVYKTQAGFYNISVPHTHTHTHTPFVSSKTFLGMEETTSTAAAMERIRVCTFNVSAAVEPHRRSSEPSDSSPPSPPPSWQYRLPRIVGFLETAKERCDVVCLQEVMIQSSEDESNGTYAELASVFKENDGGGVDDGWHAAFVVARDDDAASRGGGGATSSFKRGTAVFVKKETFKNCAIVDVPLSSGGNHCAVIEATTASAGLILHIANIHLNYTITTDSDGGGEEEEFKALIDWLDANAGKASAGQIIVGGFNAASRDEFGSNTAAIGDMMKNAGFANCLVGISSSSQCGGVNINAPTRPFDSAPRTDNIIHRGSGSSVDPDYIASYPLGYPRTTNTGVVDYDVWTEYPIIAEDPSSKSNESSRVAATFDLCGSDHFPVFASFILAASSQVRCVWI